MSTENVGPFLRHYTNTTQQHRLTLVRDRRIKASLRPFRTLFLEGCGLDDDGASAFCCCCCCCCIVAAAVETPLLMAPPDPPPPFTLLLPPTETYWGGWGGWRRRLTLLLFRVADTFEDIAAARLRRGDVGLVSAPAAAVNIGGCSSPTDIIFVQLL